MVSASKKKKKLEEQQHAKASRSMVEKRKAVKRSAMLTIIVALIIVGGYTVWAKMTGPGKYDEFAACLSSSGWTISGTDWCPYCQRQKAMFGKSFRNILYVNCDLSSACDDAGVEAYPTWSKDGVLEPAGVKDLEELAALSGCRLP